MNTLRAGLFPLTTLTVGDLGFKALRPVSSKSAWTLFGTSIPTRGLTVYGITPWQQRSQSKDADFTQMTVKLRKGIFWSDGVEFTADDLIYTVDVQKNTKGMAYTGQFSTYVDKMEKPDNYTVVFHLTKPNSRFHGLFTVRWSACFMMPKHVFEKQADVVAFKFNPPLSLGPYTLKDFDPNGNWYFWQRREDWQKTTLARFGEPAPKFAMYIAPGPSDKKVMAQKSKELDVIHDIAPEGMITLAKTNPTSRGWFRVIPLGAS